ncbi:hypothetical protein GCM10008957_34480 [Deinococcus ruber]|uniref:Uncharacterized protein n=1 Tax=Deinococcus ruber TaxID=1848197 RepID=A0A918F8F8_9DEIO|nr:hypothetical protein GCM10008957_34480 [Deinococcus ruber]
MLDRPSLTYAQLVDLFEQPNLSDEGQSNPLVPQLPQVKTALLLSDDRELKMSLLSLILTYISNNAAPTTDAL